MAKVNAYRIRSTAPTGHRRAGRRWSREPAVVAAAEVGKDALAALRADARIVIDETEIETPEPAGGKGAKGGKAADATA